MKSLLRRIFSVRHMLKPDQVIGELPRSLDIYKSTLHLAWPAIVESVLVGLVGFIDTMMVGRLDHSAIAAVGLTNQPRMIAMALFLSLNVGVTSVVARRKGENNQQDANRVLQQCLVLTLIISVTSAIVVALISRPLLLFAGAQADTIDMATSYFRIIMMGLPINALTLCINASQRGVGNTRISLVTNVTANAINIVLNFLLIEGRFGFPRLEVEGAAIATVSGNLVAFIIAIVSVSKPGHFLYMRFKDYFKGIKLEWRTLSSVIKVGSSAAVEQLFMRIGFFLYAKIVGDLGTEAFATHQICMQIASMSFCFGDGLSIAASSLVGQNLGKKRPDLAQIYGKTCQRLGFAMALVLFVVFITGRRWLVGLFTPDQEIINMGAPLLVILAFISPAQISQVIFSGSLRGAGDTKFVAFLSLIAIGIVRPGTSWLLCYPVGLGLIGAWYGFIIDQYLRLAMTAIRFSSGKWSNIRL
nr:MATE family efflux transporter [bacterium]